MNSCQCSRFAAGSLRCCPRALSTATSRPGERKPAVPGKSSARGGLELVSAVKKSSISALLPEPTPPQRYSPRGPGGVAGAKKGAGADKDESCSCQADPARGSDGHQLNRDDAPPPCDCACWSSSDLFSGGGTLCGDVARASKSASSLAAAAACAGSARKAPDRTLAARRDATGPTDDTLGMFPPI